jgi:hypothetical protein
VTRSRTSNSASSEISLDGSSETLGSGDHEQETLEKSIRTFLFLLLLLVVTVILAGSIMFSDNSRVFLLKSVSAVLLSIIPGWIYLQFIRNKGRSLYDEYVLNLFRLRIDEMANLPAPPQHTSWYPKWLRSHREIVPENVTDNLYRRKFESVYGPSAVSTIALTKKRPLSLKEKTETFAPVVMATIVIAMAWTLVLQPELLDDINLIRGEFELSGRPILPADPLRFAFLGAYAFILIDLGRRYFRDDLKSAAYISATTRILFASALIVAMDAAGFDNLVSDGQSNFVAFFVGFFPRAGFTWLRAMLPGKLQASIPQLESDYPLRHLEGLNIWYESRLIEEGIESLQNLCSASLVDLMLKTRIPVMRLVDWLDQAYLHLHLPKDPDAPEHAPPGVLGLRGLGIRTATELERTWKYAKRASDQELRLSLGRALIPAEPERIDSMMTSLMLSFRGEPNLWHVRAFRELIWLRGDRPPRLVAEPPIDATIRLEEVDSGAPTATQTAQASSVIEGGGDGNGSDAHGSGPSQVPGSSTG